MNIHFMPRMAIILGTTGIALLHAHAAHGQLPPQLTSTPPATLPAVTPLGPAVPFVVAPEVRQVLQLLRDRKTTLKDFIANIDYSVEDKVGDITGKRGTMAFIMDPVKGAMFSADFVVNTRQGKDSLKYHTQFIFDSRELTIKELGEEDKLKQFVRTNMLPAGAKPGDAVSLNGALPLPIGIEVEEVVKTFEATLLPAKAPDTAILKLVPRKGTKFEYESLVVTVDKKLELPTQLVMTAPGGDSVTTILLKEIKPNTGTAKMLNSATPASDGWTERK